MSLIETIRKHALMARKTHDPMVGLLTTLIGEVEKETKKQSPARELTDGETVAIVQKFVKNLDENIALLSTKDPERAYKFIQERNALTGYLPQQMEPDQIAGFARDRKAEGQNLGQIMSALKAEFGGRYDGKIASGIVRDVIAETEEPRP